MTDQDLLNKYWKRIYMWKRLEKLHTKEEEEYIKNRFKNYTSDYQVFHCMKLGIDPDKEICPVCGKYNKYINAHGRIYSLGCCIKHAEQSPIRNYHIKLANENKTIEEKEQEHINRSNAQKNLSEEVKQHKKQLLCITLEKKYGAGITCSFQAETVKEKIKETNIKRRGVSSSAMDPKVKKKQADTIERKHGKGIRNAFQIPEVLESFAKRKDEIQFKRDETKRRNGTHRSSKVQNYIQQKLSELFGKSNVIFEYNGDNRYPWKCDFYIKSLDMFIEYQGIWTHGGHPYVENSKEDINKLNVWKEKAKTSKFYQKAIEVWTIYDVLKRNTAKQNKIKFIELWNLEQFEKWIKQFEKI